MTCPECSSGSPVSLPPYPTPSGHLSWHIFSLKVTRAFLLFSCCPCLASSCSLCFSFHLHSRHTATHVQNLLASMLRKPRSNSVQYTFCVWASFIRLKGKKIPRLYPITPGIILSLFLWEKSWQKLIGLLRSLKTSLSWDDQGYYPCAYQH